MGFSLLSYTILLILIYFLKGSDYGDDNRVVCVIPGGQACKPDRFNKLSSLSRVNEMDIICAALSGQLDLSILISPCGKYYYCLSSNMFALLLLSSF